MISDDAVGHSVADSGSENKSGTLFPGPGGRGESGNADRNYLVQASIESDEASNSYALTEPKMSSRSGLMERMAARAGFNVQG